MRLVIVESPFAPQTPLQECVHVQRCGSRCDGVYMDYCIGCISPHMREKETARNARYLNAALADWSNGMREGEKHAHEVAKHGGLRGVHLIEYRLDARRR